MTTKRLCILICLLLVPAISRADSTGVVVLTPAEYRAQLTNMLSATLPIDSSGSAIPPAFHQLPMSWHVRADQREFDISTEGLQRDIRRYEKDKTADNALAVRARLLSLRREIDGFEKPPADVSADRAKMNAILAQPEFGSHNPGWLDRINKRIEAFLIRLRDGVLSFLLRILRRLFGWSAIPTVSKFVVYALIGAALLALIYIVYRTIWRGRDDTEIVPRDLPVSAKEWAIWLAEARAAAAKGEWRDAIHLAYWAGISFLERQGFWKPDRARTPREYLRLLSASSEHRDTLAALTRIFELAWYAKRDASEVTFSQTLAELEKLGCR
jgi:Domain of unknown function (DUF4129)